MNIASLPDEINKEAIYNKISKKMAARTRKRQNSTQVEEKINYENGNNPNVMETEQVDEATACDNATFDGTVETVKKDERKTENVSRPDDNETNGTEPGNSDNEVLNLDEELFAKAVVESGKMNEPEMPKENKRRKTTREVFGSDMFGMVYGY